jgi:hypothetical protein
MKLLDRVALFVALRRLASIFEGLTAMPDSATLRRSGFRCLPMHGQLRAARWTGRLARQDKNQVTRVLLSGVRQANRNRRTPALQARLSLLDALAAEGLAASVEDWMRDEFGVSISQRSSAAIQLPTT